MEGHGYHRAWCQPTTVELEEPSKGGPAARERKAELSRDAATVSTPKSVRDHLRARRSAPLGPAALAGAPWPSGDGHLGQCWLPGAPARVLCGHDAVTSARCLGTGLALRLGGSQPATPWTLAGGAESAVWRGGRSLTGALS